MLLYYVFSKPAHYSYTGSSGIGGKGRAFGETAPSAVLAFGERMKKGHWISMKYEDCLKERESEFEKLRLSSVKKKAEIE